MALPRIWGNKGLTGRIFRQHHFLEGFLSNHYGHLLDLSATGIGVDLYLAAEVACGTLLFQNISIIRRQNEISITTG